MFSRTIFITGASGFLGSYILREILSKKEIKVVLLVRDKNFPSFRNDLISLPKRICGSGYHEKIQILRGDITKKNLGLNIKTYEELSENIDEIYHCAASTDFKSSWKIAESVNITGTKNILVLATKSKKLKKISYLSTIFIAGDTKKKFTEIDFNLKQNFNNSYEKSKFLAEKLVRGYSSNSDLLVLIFRPSIISGEFKTGFTTQFNLLYETLRLFSMNLFVKVPLNRQVHFNIIPVDLAAKVIFLISEKSHKSGVFHIIDLSTNISLGHFLDLASDYFGYSNPLFISSKFFKRNKLTPAQNFLLDPFVPYFNLSAEFSAKQTESLLNSLGFNFPEINDSYLVKLFNFCKNSRYIKPNKFLKDFYEK